jgi:hypothetical protein
MIDCGALTLSDLLIVNIPAYVTSIMIDRKYVGNYQLV